MQIRSATEADAGRISGLIRSLSGPFMLSPDGSGAERFLESISEQAIRGYILATNFSYLVAEFEGELAGVVALRDNSHLYHLFVAPAHQGKASVAVCGPLSGRRRFSLGNSGRFTVNSSLNAVPVYARFGFVPTGPKVETHGVAFVPMQLVAGKNGG